MAQMKFDKSPVEPAHPQLVKLFDELRQIYQWIRGSLQSGIDAAFDRASQQIGFVVATTYPISVEIGEKSAFKSVASSNEQLKGTLLEKEIVGFMRNAAAKQTIGKVPPGTYNLYLPWLDALKLRFRTEWLEPAHFRIRFPWQSALDVPWASQAAAVSYLEKEPAHWFGPGWSISHDEMVIISVIDEVYPELQLVDRIAIQRQAGSRRVRPDIPEPAHFFPGVREPAHIPIRDLLGPEATLEDVLSALRSRSYWR